jgi:hypothetical protein
LFLLPLSNKKKTSGLIWVKRNIFVCNWIFLTYIGSKGTEIPYSVVGWFRTMFYFYIIYSIIKTK